jgi:hypothetical protein
MSDARPARGGRRLSRRAVVLAMLGVASAALAAAQSTWVTATTTSAVRPDVPLAVSGHAAAPGATAGALVVAAAALAMTLGGRIGTRVAGVVAVLGGVLVAASAVAVLRDPAAPASGAAVDAVGVPVLSGDPAVGVAAVLTLLLGGLLAALGVVSVVRAPRWAGSPRVATRAVPGEPDDRDRWDALTRGEDPT